MKGRKRVYIDWTYYQPGNPNPIAAFFTKDDGDYISYVREDPKSRAASPSAGRKGNGMASVHDHVVVESGMQKILCKNCGESYSFTLPIPIGMWLAASHEFDKQHKHCKPRRKEGKRR